MSSVRILIVCSILSSAPYTTIAMDNNPTSFIIYCQRVILEAAKTLEPPLKKSLFQQSLYATKSVSSKLITSCYNHPKLFFGATSVTILLVALKRSSLWPITKHDLKKLKRDTTKNAHKQLQEFIKNNNQASQESSIHIASSIDAAEEQLLFLQHDLEQNHESLAQLPAKIAQSFTAHKAQEHTLYNELFMQAERQSTSQLNSLESRAAELMHNDELIIGDFLKQLLQETILIENSCNETHNEVMQSLTQETEMLHQLMHQNSHQESLHYTQLDATMNKQQQYLSGRVDSLILLLTQLSEDQTQKSSNKKVQ